MQNCTTILGIIDMRQRGISYDGCRSRYHIDCSTISLIMSRFHACGKDLDTLKPNVRRGGGVFILSTGKFTQKR